MNEYDCIIFNVGAVNANTAFTKDKTVSPVGDYFEVYQIDAQEACIVEVKAGGTSTTISGDGIMVGHAYGGPNARSYVNGVKLRGKSFSLSGRTLETAFVAAHGRVALHGHWRKDKKAS